MLIVDTFECTDIRFRENLAVFLNAWMGQDPV